MRARRVAGAVAAVLVLGLCSIGAAPIPGLAEGASPPSTTEARVARLDDELTRWEAFGFSGAVLVAQGERVLLARELGLADRARGAHVTSETLFDIGSLSKQFTAAAVLALADDGRLRLDESIAAVLPGVPENKRSITPHHLLTHTAGISDFGRDDELVSRDELVRQILAAPLAHPAGAEYEYSNLGYSLLAALVERASGEPFESFLERRLFAPAGLLHTRVGWAPAAAGDSVALGYGGYSDAAAGEDPRQRLATWRRRGNGDVLSTTRDLVAWYRALRAGRILQPALLEAMFEPHTTAEADFLSYGYGWRLQPTEDGERLIWHSGLDGAYSTIFRHYTESDVVMVFLSNLSIGGVPMREILVRPSRSGPPATQLFSESVTTAPEYAVDAARLAAYAGNYRVGDAGRWLAQVESGALVLRAEGQEAIDSLFPPVDAAAAAAYERTSEDALRLARCLSARTCDPPELRDRVDPLGFAARNATVVAAQWASDADGRGALREIRCLGTTGLRGRHGEQTVSHLRLLFERGAADEHVIWFADDEIYVVAGQPDTLAIRFQPAPDGGLVGFDLLQQRRYTARLEDAGALVVDAGDRVTVGVKEPNRAMAAQAGAGSIGAASPSP